MITMIICMVIGFVAAIQNAFMEWWRSRKHHRLFDWSCILLGLMASLAGGLIGGILCLGIPCKYKTDRWNQEIISLQDNNSVLGQLFLGSGYIKGDMKYVFYLKEDSNTYKLNVVNYEDGAIQYTDGPPTVVITDKQRDENSILSYFTFSDWNAKRTYVFKVPKGSIKQNISLDAQ